MSWLYLEHAETGGATRIPDDEAVRVWHEARGWRVADDPEEQPFVPASSDADAGEAWIELVHPETEARHEFPNNPDALAGAADAGWVRPNKDGTVPKPATAKRRAREAQSPESPASERGSRTSGPDAAGDEQDEQAESSATDMKE